MRPLHSGDRVALTNDKPEPFGFWAFFGSAAVGAAVLAAFVFALGGCASMTDGLHDFDRAPHAIKVTGFTMAERAKVLQAVNYWNARGAKLDVLDEDDTSRKADKMIMAQRDPDKFAGKPGITVAQTIVLINTPQMVRAFALGADFCGVVAHELGHALGLDHTPGGIMGAYTTWQTRCER